MRRVPSPGSGSPTGLDRWRTTILCSGHLLLQGEDHQLIDLDVATLHQNWRTAMGDPVENIACARNRAVTLARQSVAGFASEPAYRLTTYALPDGTSLTTDLHPASGSSPEPDVELHADDSFVAVRFASQCGSPSATNAARAAFCTACN